MKRAKSDQPHGRPKKKHICHDKPPAQPSQPTDIPSAVFWLLSNLTYGNDSTSFVDIYARYAAENPTPMGTRWFSRLICKVFPGIKWEQAPTKIVTTATRLYEGISMEMSPPIPFQHVANLFEEHGYMVSIHDECVTAEVSSDIQCDGFQPIKKITFWESGTYKIAVDGKEVPLQKISLPNKVVLTRSFLANMANVVKRMEFCGGTTNEKLENEDSSEPQELQQTDSTIRSRTCYRLLPLFSTSRGCQSCQQKKKNIHKVTLRKNRNAIFSQTFSPALIATLKPPKATPLTSPGTIEAHIKSERLGAHCAVSVCQRVSTAPVLDPSPKQKTRTVPVPNPQKATALKPSESPETHIRSEKLRAHCTPSVSRNASITTLSDRSDCRETTATPVPDSPDSHEVMDIPVPGSPDSQESMDIPMPDSPDSHGNKDTPVADPPNATTLKPPDSTETHKPSEWSQARRTASVRQNTSAIPVLGSSVNQKRKTAPVPNTSASRTAKAKSVPVRPEAKTLKPPEFKVIHFRSKRLQARHTASVSQKTSTTPVPDPPTIQETTTSGPDASIALSWLLSNMNSGIGATSLHDIYTTYVKDHPLPIATNQFSKLIFAIFPGVQICQTSTTLKMNRTRLYRGIIMETAQPIPFEDVGDLFEKHGYIVSIQNQCVTAELSLDMKFDGFRPIKKITLWESGAYKIEVDGVEVSLQKIGLPNTMSIKGSFLANMADIIKRLDFCGGSTIANLHNQDSLQEQCSSENTQQAERLVRSPKCYRLLPLVAITRGCQSCTTKKKNLGRKRGDPAPFGKTYSSPPVSTPKFPNPAETPVRSNGLRADLTTSVSLKTSTPLPGPSVISQNTMTSLVPEISIAVTWLLSNMSYGRGSTSFEDICTKYTRENTKPLKGIPLAKVIATVFPEVKTRQTPINVSVQRTRLYKDIVFESPVAMPFHLVGRLFEDHGYKVTTYEDFITAVIRSEVECYGFQPVKKITLWESGDYKIAVDEVDIKLDQICLPAKLQIGGSFLANMAKLVRSIQFCTGSSANALPTEESPEQRCSSEERQHGNGIIRPKSCLRLVPLNSTCTACRICRTKRDNDSKRYKKLAVVSQSSSSAIQESEDDTTDCPSPLIEIQESQTESDIQTIPSNVVISDHLYFKDVPPDDTSTTENTDTAQNTNTCLKPGAITYEPSGRAFSNIERIQIIQEQMQAMDIEPGIMIFMLDQLRNATVEPRARRWDKHVTHLWSQLYKLNSSAYSGLASSGMIAMPSVRHLQTNSRKTKEKSQEKVPEEDHSLVMPEIPIPDVIDPPTESDIGAELLSLISFD